MKKYKPSKFGIPCSIFGNSAASRRAGFTLMEVVLVLVIVLIISSVSLPYFAGAYKGTKLRSAARTINRMAKYARSMAIMREQTFTIVLNHETMEVYLGAQKKASTSTADGELDQDVLKRLGYVDGDESSSGSLNIDKEIHRFLPDHLTVKNFEKEWVEIDDLHEDRYIINYYPNGQCEWFLLELEDQRGSGVKLENDPISGKIISEFTQ